MNEAGEKGSPRLFWDIGTAYDFFSSLYVLHFPEAFGLRGSWAAGVRSRLPAAQRAILEDAQEMGFYTLRFVYNLPSPKDAATALWALSQIPSAERLAALTICNDDHDMIITQEMLRSVSERRAWDEKDLQILSECASHEKKAPRPESLKKMLDWWACPDEFGELYLEALGLYHTSFFAEEEKRIRPVLEQSLGRAQELARHMDILDLIDELSQGIQNEAFARSPEIVFAPSYWITPLIMFDNVTPQRLLILFGARPIDQSLVPGEDVPDAMLRVIKVLADPTRLRVLRYLSEKPMAPSQLARRLRLRAPTVLHHLNALRLAGMVHVIISGEDEKRYAIRSETIDETFLALKKFLSAGV